MSLNFNFLRNELIGNNTFFHTPYGMRLITYADYTASGKTLYFIEDYLLKIQEVYANTHTEDSYTGKMMTNLLKEAERKMKIFVGANENNYFIPTGTGCTGAILKLCEILGLYLTPGMKYHFDQYVNKDRYNQYLDLFKEISKSKPVVFISPYEHHSNYLIWKECLCDVVEIELDSQGGIDLFDLVKKLNHEDYKNRMKIGSFSAASNVTGIKTNVYQIARIFHKYNALIFFDFAASGPYVEINMNYDKDSYFDAIFLSPHKFIGGPASSGILVLNKNLYSTMYPPTIAGGGTVDFVSPYHYLFLKDVEAREKAGTPGILQIIKAALALETKSLVGIDKIEAIENYYIKKVIDRMKNNPKIEILGPIDPKRRIAIFSFNIKHNDKNLHHKLVAKLLNDLFGIQSRAGCACAGPYGHRLLRISKEKSELIEKASQKGYHSLKPGFVRVNFHYTMCESDVDFICSSIEFIAKYGNLFLTQYSCDLESGAWNHLQYIEHNERFSNFGVLEAIDYQNKIINNKEKIDREKLYSLYIQQALQLVSTLTDIYHENFQLFNDPKFEQIRWFNFIYQK